MSRWEGSKESNLFKSVGVPNIPKLTRQGLCRTAPGCECERSNRYRTHRIMRDRHTSKKVGRVLYTWPACFLLIHTHNFTFSATCFFVCTKAVFELSAHFVFEQSLSCEIKQDKTEYSCMFLLSISCKIE